MKNEMKPTINIEQGVMFVPWPRGEKALYLPILPAGIDAASDEYKSFLADFIELINVTDQETRNTQILLGLGEWCTLKLEHARVSYTFSATAVFYSALKTSKSLMIIPYCATENLPQRDVYGALVPIA